MEQRKVLSRLVFLVMWAEANKVKVRPSPTEPPQNVLTSVIDFTIGTTPKHIVAEYQESPNQTLYLLDAQGLAKAEALEATLEDLYKNRSAFQVSPRLGNILGEAFTRFRRDDVK